MNDGLLRRWESLLPGCSGLGAELLARWSEPHRRYHDVRHLAETIDALVLLGPAGRAEELAVWFHDAVHANRPGTDERSSADLAAARLPLAGVAEDETAEVVRLVLVTIDHRPASDDGAGARVSDADLAVLAADPARYRASVEDLRNEMPGLDDGEWRAARLAALAGFAAQRPLFHSRMGNSLWEARARVNLASERESYGRE